MRYRLAIIIFFITAAVVAQSAVFYVPQKSVKFPKTIEGETIHYTYYVTNRGKVPLMIYSFETECTCTNVLLPTGPIDPGKTAKIDVTFNTSGKYFFQDRLITLKTNTRKKKEILHLKVFIIPKE